MQFNVSQLLQEPVGSSRHYALQAEPPVRRGEVEFIRTPTGVLLRATVEVLLEAECSRCLASFGYPRDMYMEEVYYQQVDVATGARVETEAEADSFLIDRRHVVDISEAVRQYGEMAADMQPLCRPDCPGICAQCGQDLTLSACACESEPIDPRWAPLAALKQR